MQYTENYSLRKPQMAETASVSDLNYNSDRIDAILADDRQISIAMYVSGNTYNTGDLVGYENPSTHHIRVYRCLVDNVTGTWDSTKWTLTNLADEILDAKASGGTEVEANPSGTPSDTLNTVEIDNVIYAVGGDSANQNIADAFSELQTYAVGDYCIYESILYKCTTAVETAGAWDSTKWTSCVVTDEMGSGGGGGSSTLAGLDDVGITTPTDGQLLVYDDVNDEWVNGNIAGVNVQPDVYSTEEREIGVWKDSKPLYEKTLEIPSFPSTSPISIDVTSLNIDVMASAVGEAYAISNNTITETLIFPGYVSTSYYGAIRFLNNNVQILHKGLNEYTRGIVTIQYTKTTDATGSGTWTPSGVPAVHYSTDEQVVGTWIDGSTLYEKTVHIQNTTSSFSDYINGVYMPYVSMPISMNFTAIRTGGIIMCGNSVNRSEYSTTYMIALRKNGDYLQYRCDGYGTGITDLYVTIRYTKTTT